MLHLPVDKTFWPIVDLTREQHSPRLYILTPHCQIQVTYIRVHAIPGQMMMHHPVQQPALSHTVKRKGNRYMKRKKRKDKVSHRLMVPCHTHIHTHTKKTHKHKHTRTITVLQNMCRMNFCKGDFNDKKIGCSRQIMNRFTISSASKQLFEI